MQRAKIGPTVGYNENSEIDMNYTTNDNPPISTMVPPPSEKPKYYAALVAFMNYRDNPEVPYTLQTLFTEEELLTINPEELMRWLNYKVYGMPDPSPDDRPTVGRANTMLFRKKAISYYMPNKITPWDVQYKRGNPTKSVLLNQIIDKVKKFQVRRKGKELCARRPIEVAEFEQTLKKLQEHSDIKRKYMVPAAIKFQYSMVACVDDTAHFQAVDLKPNSCFDFALTASMAWLKNIMEERDSPNQILMGSINTKYCVLLGLSVYLEVSLDAGLGVDHPYLFGHTNNAKKNKNYIANSLLGVWKQPGFDKIKDGKLGTPNLRKFPATRARQSGCSKDEMGTRGRWKKGRVSDVYVSTTHPFPDAKMCSVLCAGGLCKYCAAEGSGLSDPWLLQSVVPAMEASDKIADGVALILSRPLLWAAFNSETENVTPVTLRNKIRDAYALIWPASFSDDANPIDKVPVIVTGYEAELHIDKVAAVSGVDGEDGIGIGTGAQRENLASIPVIRALYSRVVGLEGQLQDFRAENSRLLQQVGGRISTLTRLVNRIALQPVARPRNTNESTTVGTAGLGRVANANATLFPGPKNLYVLWDEWMYGLDGIKPARLFTAVERGRSKRKFSRRRVVWDKISEMVLSGMTAHTAIDAIYHHYGHNKSVTTIIDEMRKDRRERNNIVLAPIQPMEIGEV